MKHVTLLGRRVHLMTTNAPAITRRMQRASTGPVLRYTSGVCIRPLRRFPAVLVTWDEAA